VKTPCLKNGLILFYIELLLYLLILTTQGKHADAVSLLEGDLGRLCKVESDQEKLLVESLTELKEWERIKNIAASRMRTEEYVTLFYC
jgi:hypothetical protein